MADGGGSLGTVYSAFIDVQDGSMHPELVAKTLSGLLDDDAIVTADVGLPAVWAARFVDINPKQRLLGSFNHGSMANALPQALGAQAADRRRALVVGVRDWLAGGGCRVAMTKRSKVPWRPLDHEASLEEHQPVA